MLDLDSLIAEAELETGLPVAVVAARHPAAQVAAQIEIQDSKLQRLRWSDSEIQFLEENLGVLPLEVIGAELGRTANAIKIRQVRQRLPAPSKRSGWLTGHQVALLLGVDVHAVCRWTDMGLLPHQLIPGERCIRAIRYITLLRWAVNPMNWIYFKHSVDDTCRILDQKLRRLIERQKERWADEWWSIGEVAAYHGVHHTDVNRYIHHGKIQATDYGNWWIRRSEATRPDLKFYKGKGAAMEAYTESRWSPAADAYILRAKAEGLIWAEIARRMKRKESSVQHRGRKLLRQSEAVGYTGIKTLKH